MYHYVMVFWGGETSPELFVARLSGITEELRLGRTSGNHLVQPSSLFKAQSVRGGCPEVRPAASVMPLRMEAA